MESSLFEDPGMGALGPRPGIVTAQGWLEFALLIPYRHTVAAAPGIAMALQADAALLKDLQGQGRVAGLFFDLAGPTGLRSARHQGPRFQFCRWSGQPMGTIAIAESGVQCGELLVKQLIPSAAPGSFQKL